MSLTDVVAFCVPVSEGIVPYARGIRSAVSAVSVSEQIGAGFPDVLSYHDVTGT